MNFFIKHWKGDYSLKRSFWINYVLLNIGLSFSFAYLLLYFIRSGRIDLIERSLMNYYLAVFLISLWQAVGIYRSSRRYEQQTGKKVLVWIARTLTLFSTAHNLLSFMMILSLTPEASQKLIEQFQVLAQF